MRILIALAFVVAACGGPKKKPEGAVVPEGSGVAETCCCKTNPLTSVDGKPEYQVGGRMECSTNKGECVDDVQCNKSPQPE